MKVTNRVCHANAENLKQTEYKGRDNKLAGCSHVNVDSRKY